MVEEDALAVFVTGFGFAADSAAQVSKCHTTKHIRRVKERQKAISSIWVTWVIRFTTRCDEVPALLLLRIDSHFLSNRVPSLACKTTSSGLGSANGSFVPLSMSVSRCDGGIGRISFGREVSSEKKMDGLAGFCVGDRFTIWGSSDFSAAGKVNRGDGDGFSSSTSIASAIATSGRGTSDALSMLGITPPTPPTRSPLDCCGACAALASASAFAAFAAATLCANFDNGLPVPLAIGVEAPGD